MKRAEFIALSACSMTLTALGIDIMLPVFTVVRAHFGLPAESTLTAQIITFFFLGQIAQLLFGTLSDSFGRLAILRVGFPLYIAGGIVAAFSPSLEVMFAARFVAGMGAAAVMTTTVAGVRDRFVGDEMARIMSLIFTIFMFTPILAPFLGIAILSIASWQVVFLTPPFIAVIVFLWTLRLEESLPREKRTAFNWKSTVRSVQQVVGNRVFLRYTTLTTLLFAALSSYVASSERIVGQIYGRPELFAWIFAGIGMLMSFCSLINSKLSVRYGALRAIKYLLIAYTFIAGVLLIYSLFVSDPPSMAIFFICVAALLAINIAIEPNSSALALEPMGNVAGMAASAYGTAFFFFGAGLGAIISGMMVSGVLPLVIAFFVIGVITLFLAFGNDRRKKLSVS